MFRAPSLALWCVRADWMGIWQRLCRIAWLSNCPSVRKSISLIKAMTIGDREKERAKSKYSIHLTPRAPRTEGMCSARVQLIAIVVEHFDVVAAVALAWTLVLTNFHYRRGCLPDNLLEALQSEWQTIQCVAAKDENKVEKEINKIVFEPARESWALYRLETQY